MCLYLQDQYTPLYAASAKGFNDVVKSLIAANADVNYMCKVSFYITVHIIALKMVQGYHLLVDCLIQTS